MQKSNTVFTLFISNLFQSKKKINGFIDFSNNEIIQFDFENIFGINLYFDFRFNIDYY